MKTMFKEADGTIWFDKSAVYIERRSQIDTLLHAAGVTTIPPLNIEMVEWQEGGLINGFICIKESGRSAPSSVFSAPHDENTIIFRMFKNNVAFAFVNRTT